MARPFQFIEMASGASGVFVALASIPSGADNAVVRVFSGSIIYSETSGSWLSATANAGQPLSGLDAPIRIDGGQPSGGLLKFGFRPMGGGAVVSVLYYGYEGRSTLL